MTPLRLLSALIFTICSLSAVYALVVASVGSSVTHPRLLPPRVPPAFYSGGLERGRGGELEQDWDTVDSSNLFTPSQARNSSNALMPAAAYPPPESCGSCHVAVHENWARSTHSVSATDELYLAVKELFAFERGEPAVRLCAGCHAPVALVTGEVGLYNRESASSQQGVSCAFCHSVDSVHGGNGAYVSDPARVRAYLGGDHLKPPSSGLTLGDRFSRWLLEQKPEAHKQDMMSPALATGQVCQSCHSFTINGVKVQSTWEEWEGSGYAARGVTCQGCHFNSSTAPDVLEPGEVAKGRQRSSLQYHSLGGGSTLASPRAAENLETLRASVGLEAKLARGKLEVTVRNLKAGHHLPTGVADLRQLWLEVTATDDSGREVYTSGRPDAAGELPQGTTLFHLVLGDEQGNPLLRHDIWRAARVLEDTRIPAEGARRASFTLPSGAHKARVRLLWRDVPASFAQWVLRRNGASVPVRELKVWEGER